MESMEELKKAYAISDQDAENLKSVRGLAERHKDEFISKFYDYVLRFDKASHFLTDEEVIARHKEKVTYWFLHIFSGEYNEEYLRSLYRVGEVHVKVGLPGHYVNASLNFVRRYCYKVLTDEFGCSKQKDMVINSLDKILDLNLDVMTISYREEELRSHVLPRKLEIGLIEFARKFAFSVDLVLIFILMVAALFVLGFVGYEIYSIASGEVTVETGILKILGTLLMIWAIGELLNAEIHHLRGGKFAINSFITLAIAAVIRKILVASMSTEKIHDAMILGGIVLILGIVFWLVGHTEKG
ncbi:MAG: phosphate-starvation-inducible PsiE family protein [Nitrospirae bacterium]|nr:phosphate-starvation-inducible PsiE family protein [Nitrospirota bacterium]